MRCVEKILYTSFFIKERKEKLNLKYNARNIDEIEQAKKMSLEQCISNTNIDMLAIFIQKGMIDDNGIHGVSRNVALDTIDKYLEENDKDDLILDIMEALSKTGFLSKNVDVERVRSLKKNRVEQINKELDNI